MKLSGKDLLAKLEKEILPLQGYQSSPTENYIPIGFPPIENAFPNAQFPAGCLHEFVTLSQEDVSATAGFITGLLRNKMLGGVCLWISASRVLFPAALTRYGIHPQQVIFVDVKKERDVLYATEEALKCSKLIAVVSEAKDISFKESRRFQLAAGQSRVTSFLLRHQPRALQTIACVSRWHITSIASEFNDDMPGVGFPRWEVDLQKVRSGKPGKWQIEWSANGFTEIRDQNILLEQMRIKMG